MNPSAPFFGRPIATTLLTIGIALAGILLQAAGLGAATDRLPTIAVQRQLPAPAARPSQPASRAPRAIPRQDRQRDRNDLAKWCRPDLHRPAIRSSRTVCTAAWVPIVPPKVVDFGDSIDQTSQLVGRLHQRHLKPTQCPTIRAISRKIDATVRTIPTSHPTVASLPNVFREGQCSLWSTKPGLLRKPLQDRCV